MSWTLLYCTSSFLLLIGEVFFLLGISVSFSIDQPHDSQVQSLTVAEVHRQQHCRTGSGKFQKLVLILFIIIMSVGSTVVYVCHWYAIFAKPAVGFFCSDWTNEMWLARSPLYHIRISSESQTQWNVFNWTQGTIIPVEDSRWVDGCGTATLSFDKNENVHVRIILTENSCTFQTWSSE